MGARVPVPGPKRHSCEHKMMDESWCFKSLVHQKTHCLRKNAAPETHLPKTLWWPQNIHKIVQTQLGNYYTKSIFVEIVTLCKRNLEFFRFRKVLPICICSKKVVFSFLFHFSGCISTKNSTILTLFVHFGHLPVNLWFGICLMVSTQGTVNSHVEMIEKYIIYVYNVYL